MTLLASRERKRPEFFLASRERQRSSRFGILGWKGFTPSLLAPGSGESPPNWQGPRHRGIPEALRFQRFQSGTISSATGGDQNPCKTSSPFYEFTPVEGPPEFLARWLLIDWTTRT
jgi:hypothetical protein